VPIAVVGRRVEVRGFASLPKQRTPTGALCRSLHRGLRGPVLQEFEEVAGSHFAVSNSARPVAITPHMRR